MLYHRQPLAALIGCFQQQIYDILGRRTTWKVLWEGIMVIFRRWFDHKNNNQTINLIQSGNLIDGLKQLSDDSASNSLFKEIYQQVCVGNDQAAAEMLWKAHHSGSKEAVIEVLLKITASKSFKDDWNLAESWLPPRLYHFTDLANLPEILHDGKLLSRARMEIQRASPRIYGGDVLSWARDCQLGLQDYIHLAVRAPHPMLIAASRRIRQPVYLTFSPVLALRKESRYSDRNATDLGAEITDRLSSFKVYLYQATSGEHPSVNKLAQAEVLVMGSIELSMVLLDGILFRSRYEMEKAVKECGSEGWILQKMGVAEEVFY
jgi:hypothetical protein